MDILPNKFSHTIKGDVFRNDSIDYHQLFMKRQSALSINTSFLVGDNSTPINKLLSVMTIFTSHFIHALPASTVLLPQQILLPPR